MRKISVANARESKKGGLSAPFLFALHPTYAVTGFVFFISTYVSTAATAMGELGISPHVIEGVLNHVSGFRHGVAGLYNLARLEGPIRHALTVWNAHVMEIVEGRVRGDRVVPLRP